MTEGHAEIRKGRDVIAEVLCSGIEKTRVDSEYGQAVGTGISARYLATADVGVAIGDAIEIRMSGATAWSKFRAVSRMDTGGVVRLTLEAEFA